MVVVVVVWWLCGGCVVVCVSMKRGLGVVVRRRVRVGGIISGGLKRVKKQG